MKVCLISHSSAKGGAERSLLEIIDALKVRGVETYVTLPSYGPLVEELKNRGIVFQIFPYRWWVSKRSPFWKRIARTILNFVMVIPLAVGIVRHRCEIICTNTITVCLGGLAARLVRRPHVWYIREFGYEDHKLTYDLGTKLSLKLIELLSSVCIVNSEAIARKYREFIPEQKLKVVYQAVNIPDFFKMDPKSSQMWDSKAGIRCVIVGVLQESKGQEDAIRAIDRLVKGGIEAELYIVGSGDPEYEKYLRNLTMESGLGHRIKFVGYTESVFSFMQNADVALMCSRYEAFGRVTIEAMKIGKPVVGARSGGTSELIRDGFNGFLYRSGDCKELAEKVKYLYEHPDISRQMGENGLRWATNLFSQDRYGKDILTIFETICGHKSK